MKRRILASFVGFLCFLLFVACDTSEEKIPDVEETTFTEYVPGKEEVAYEEYMMGIDSDDALGGGNSLFYSKGNGEYTEVEFLVNEKNEMVKMIQYYTQETLTVAKNIFYFKEGKKFATRELFEQGPMNNLSFVERITYYDQDEKPIVTKQRVAPYEQDLELESFRMADKHDCSAKRAFEILNQQGEFNTTFQGFVSEDAFLYLVVGGPGANDYTSSLLVQNVDQTIKKLQSNEMGMIGTPLIVNFDNVKDGGEGYEYQILLAVGIR